MKRSTFLILSSIYYGAFGLGLLLVPAIFVSVFGATLDKGGILVGRILGAALLNLTLIVWWNRNSPNSEMLKAILRANFFFNLIDMPVLIFGIMTGAMGVTGWLPVLIHVPYVVGFGYFGFIKQ